METAACECGAVETVFRTEPQADSCESCVSKESWTGVPCNALPPMQLERTDAAARSEITPILAPFRAHPKDRILESSSPRPSEDAQAKQDPSVVTFLSNFTARDQWWEAPGGHASVWTRRPKAEEAWIPTRSPSRLVCSRSQVSPGRSGTPATFALTRCPGRASSYGAPRRLPDKTRAEVSRLAGWLRDLRAEVSRGRQASGLHQHCLESLLPHSGKLGY